MTPARVKSVSIVGAGVAGLAAAKCLVEKGFICTIYDRQHELGGVWADGYAGFGVQVQKDLYEFPDFPLPPGAENFTPGPAFQRYLEDYSDHFGVRDCLRLGARVAAVTRNPEGGWTLHVETPDGPEEAHSDFLVIATGLYSETPHIPEIAGADRFAGQLLHSSQVRDFDMLKGRNVVVVGYGKSATDIAACAVPVAKSVRLVFRTAHWPVPRKLLGLLPFKWGMLTRLTAALIPPWVRPSPAARLLHSVGKPLPWLFWRVVEVLLRVQQRLGTRIEGGETLVPAHDVLFDAYSEKTMVPRPGLIGLIRDGKIKAHRSTLSRFTETSLILGDSSEIATDCVVFGTGWSNSYDFLPEDLKRQMGETRDGLYLYRHMLHPAVPDLAFLGRMSSFMSVTTYTLQARWLAEVLSGKVTLPPEPRMAAAISDLKAWKRSWMPESPARSGTLLLHMACYHDELLLDMGQDPLRKCGILAPLKELLVPYRASDFREVV